MAWWRFRPLARACASIRAQSASGSRTERTVVGRLPPFRGRPRRTRTASAANCGISQRAASDGPPGSPAPANARRRTGPNREKSTGPSRGSVVLITRALVRRRPASADDPDDILEDFRVDDIEQPAPIRLADEDEPLRMERIRVVGTELVVECRARLFERDACFLRLAVALRASHVNRTKNCTTFKPAGADESQRANWEPQRRRGGASGATSWSTRIATRALPDP